MSYFNLLTLTFSDFVLVTHPNTEDFSTNQKVSSTVLLTLIPRNKMSIDLNATGLRTSLEQDRSAFRIKCVIYIG